MPDWLEPGRVVASQRGFYDHYGIATPYRDGREQLILDFGKKVHAPKRVKLSEFLGGGKLALLSEPSRLSYPEIENRAVVYPSRYDLIFNNCEHFARYCAGFERESRQVGAVALAFVIAGLVYVLSAK